MRRSVLAVAAAAIAFLGTTLAPGGTSADSVFAPATAVKMCNAMPADFVDPAFGGSASCPDVLTAGSATSTTATYSAPIGNLNPYTLVTFLPTLKTTGATGDRLAGARLNATIGVANGPCVTALQLDFVLYKVDPASAPSYPLAPGTANRFLDWRVGSTALPGDGGIIAGVDVNHAGPASRPLTNIPQYVLDAFSPATPTAVYGGLTNTGLGEWMPLYMVQFGAGGLSTAPGVYSTMTSSMGFPLVWVLGDPTASQQSPSNPSDICDTLNITTTLLGTTNPAAGTAMFLQYAASERDLDQDGFGNAIDTCPYNAAPAENPRNALGVNDTDSDGVMNSCDTNLPDAADADVDNDSFDNRLDNCPQIANATQAESETAVPADLGPRSDALGDACDGAQGGPAADGTITITQNGKAVTVGVGNMLSDTVANGRYMTRTNVVAKCFDSGPEIDADGDGYCVSGGVTADNADSGVCTGTVPNSCAVRHALWLGATNPALQLDSDGDNVVPAFGGTISYFTDAAETYLTTDPTKPCAQTRVPTAGAANDEGPLDNWPLDMNDDGLISGSDYLKYNTVLGLAAGGFRAVNMGGDGNGTATTPATISSVPFMGVQSQTRFDLNLDGFLNGADLGKFSAYFSRTCGLVGTPPTTLGGTFQQ